MKEELKLSLTKATNSREVKNNSKIFGINGTPYIVFV